MRKVDIINKLLEGIKMHYVLKITRENIDEDPIYCIPLVLKEDLLLFQYLYDFSFDGYKVIRINDITFVRHGDVEEFTELILKKEGKLNDIKKPLITNISNLGTFFKEYMKLNKVIIIECETLETQDFNIGEITDVNIDSLKILCFDGVGEWEQEPYEIPFKDITSVTFDDEYSVTIFKYVK